jgi:hypothetical protein
VVLEGNISRALLVGEEAKHQQGLIAEQKEREEKRFRGG